MANISFGERLKRGRIKNAWTQTDFGRKVGVSAMTVSNWENGKSVPDKDQKNHLREVLGVVASDSANGHEEPIAEQSGPSTFGNWLNRTRQKKEMSVVELASKARISPPAIYNIEAGRIANPRADTVVRLEKALGEKLQQDIKEEIRDEATIEGFEFRDFDPHNKEDWPDEPGIYVLYDISERPIYVGQGGSIKKRIQDHEEKFWFKHPIVSTAAFIRVDENSMRKKIEAILIRFLKRNAVINKQNVDR